MAIPIVYVATAKAINIQKSGKSHFELPLGNILMDVPIVMENNQTIVGAKSHDPNQPYGTHLIIPAPSRQTHDPNPIPAVTNGDKISFIVFNNVSHAKASHFSIERQVHAGLNSFGISIQGSDIEVSDIDIKNSYAGVHLVKDISVVPIISQRITLKDITYVNKQAFNCAYGLLANNVDTLYVTNCNWSYSYLDGIKLDYKCSHVYITDGSSNNNGIGQSTSSNSGDGIDVFSGGSHVTITGITLANNGGNGITIKTKGGYIDPYAVTPYFCDNITDFTITGIKTISNNGSGITIEGVYDWLDDYEKAIVNKAGEALLNEIENNRQRANNITIKNCQMTGDKAWGIFINGTNVTVDSCTVTQSYNEGIRIGHRANGVTIKNTTITACSQRPKINVYNVAISIEEKAQNCLLQNVIMDGLMPGETDITKSTHSEGIYFYQYDFKYMPTNPPFVLTSAYTSATNVSIISCQNLNTQYGEGTTAQGSKRSPAYLPSHPDAGNIYIEHSDTFHDPTNIMAGIGSKYTDISSGDPATYKFWLKTSDPQPTDPDNVSTTLRGNGWAPQT